MRFLVTAGPTREPLDPVRFISNRSSGRMGFAIAAAAQRFGHAVTLVTGPVALPDPTGVTLMRVTTADDMLKVLEAELPGADVLIMAAAVADFRPRHVQPIKIKKAVLAEAGPTLELEPTPDILLRLGAGKGHRYFVGFAAETGDPVPEARRKCRAKQLDLVVANDVTEEGAGFDVPTNRVRLVSRDGTVEDWPLQSKAAIGERLVRVIEARYAPPLKIQSMACV